MDTELEIIRTMSMAIATQSSLPETESSAIIMMNCQAILLEMTGVIKAYIDTKPLVALYESPSSNK
jgi:hypothetical protein